MGELGLPAGNYSRYAEYIRRHTSEWKELEAMTHITISRFFRDGPVWQYMLSTVLPTVAALATEADGPMRTWIMGFSSGEEVYSLKAAWALGMAHHRGALPELEIIASEYDKTA